MTGTPRCTCRAVALALGMDRTKAERARERDFEALFGMSGDKGDPDEPDDILDGNLEADGENSVPQWLEPRDADVSVLPGVR